MDAISMNELLVTLLSYLTQLLERLEAPCALAYYRVRGIYILARRVKRKGRG